MATPKLRFKEFDGDWSVSNLEQTTQYFKGFAFKSESYKEEGIRIIRVSDLDKDSIKYQNEAIFLDKIEAQNYLNWEVKKKDIIVTTVGSKPHLIDSAVGRPIFVKNDSEGLLNQNLLVLRPKNENIDAYFIFSQLLDKKYLTHIETIQRGNANQSNITVKDLQEFEVFQTSKEEQTKIASFLSAVDEKISQLTKKHELLSQYKQGMMQKLFSQQIRFKADDGSEFGEWRNYKLKDLTDIYDGTHQTPNYVEQGVPFYSVEHVTANDFSNTKFIAEDVYQAELKRVTLQKGDILMTRIGDIGTSRLIDWDVRASFYVSLALIKIKNGDNSSFIDQYIKSQNFQRELHERTIHVAFPKKINLGEIGLCMIQLPCLEEQTKIANFLSDIDQKIEVVAQQIEQAKQWKKGLLQQMFV